MMFVSITGTLSQAMNDFSSIFASPSPSKRSSVILTTPERFRTTLYVPGLFVFKRTAFPSITVSFPERSVMDAKGVQPSWNS
ncbi:hypothetical protein D1872_319640 [compost metagenome]